MDHRGPRDPGAMTRLKLSLCAECGAEAASDLMDKLKSAGLPDGVEITKSACLGPCDRPLALALQTPEKAGYVFAGITGEDSADIAATCALVLSSDHGWIEDARPCGRLRLLLVARMPG
ncbi:MAG: DUF1636 family protein [Paracoccaceae bacterium]